MIKNNNAQMMVLESVLFSITIIISLIFLIQLAPSSINVNSNNVNELELIGANALKAVYNEKVSISSGGMEQISPDSDATLLNNPVDKISVCIICNNFIELSKKLNENISENNVLFNLYINNGDESIAPYFICSSVGTIELPMTKPIAQANCFISIDPVHLGLHTEASMIEDMFGDGATYQITMKLWRIGA